jgi:4a-hydroxytetrahydrobiopterin dehydratase
MSDAISPRQFQEAEGVVEWRVVGDGGCAFYATGSLAESARFVAAIAALDGVKDTVLASTSATAA